MNPNADQFQAARPAQRDTACGWAQVWEKNFPKPQRIGPMNRDRQILRGRGNIFSPSPGERAGVRAGFFSSTIFGVQGRGLTFRAGESAAGFTLIEMILAIGISALVLIATGTVLYTALRLRDDTADMVDAASPVDAAMAFIKRDLECVMTTTNGTTKILSGGFRAGNGLSSVGVSDPVAVEMYTATGAESDSAPWSDIQRVTYELKSSLNAAAAGQGALSQHHPEFAGGVHAGSDRTAHAQRGGEPEVLLLRRHAVERHLGHDRSHLDQHEPAGGRAGGYPDGRERLHAAD